MESRIKKVLVSEAEIDEITTKIAAEISEVYKNSDHLVLVSILKGSVVFFSDILRKLSVPAEIDFMKVSSYNSGTESSGFIKIHLDLSRDDLSDLDILIIEDIVDSGYTLSYLVRHLFERGAKSVRTCTLLDKPSRRKVEFKPDFCGREIPDEFVIGYGLDYDEKFRTLPYVGVLELIK